MGKITAAEWVSIIYACAAAAHALIRLARILTRHTHWIYDMITMGLFSPWRLHKWWRP